MNLSPVLGKVIVEVKKEDSRIEGTRLVIPEVAREKELGYGVCLSGEYKGKQVYFKKYSGDEVEIDGKNLFVIDEEDLLCVVD